MNILESIDIFGENIYFQFNKKEKLKTTTGGIFTLITILMGFAISFLFGKDFYLRTNPQLTKNIISPSKNPSFKLSNKNLTIPYRIEDNSGRPIEDSIPLFLKVNYIQYKATDSIFNNTYSQRFKIKNALSSLKRISPYTI